jgi:hypothetical protein
VLSALGCVLTRERGGTGRGLQGFNEKQLYSLPLIAFISCSKMLFDFSLCCSSTMLCLFCSASLQLCHHLLLIGKELHLNGEASATPS